MKRPQNPKKFPQQAQNISKTSNPDGQKSRVSTQHFIEDRTGWFSNAPGSGRIWIWLLILSAVTFLTYIPSLKNGFTNWDDEEYIYHNPTIREVSGKTVTNMFAGPNKYYMGNYHPLTMLSLAIDQKIGQSQVVKSFGKSLRGKEIIPADSDFEPFIFHLTNLILHLVCTISVFWFIFLFWGNFWLAFAASLLFGLNAMHVESVTWVAERKDVLYSAFFFLSLISYVKYLNSSKIKFLLLTFILFVLSCFSKGQAVSLAVTLILLDLVKRRNLLSKKVILEKVPFLLAALVFGVFAINAQQAMGTILEVRLYPFYVRIANASYAFVHYLYMLFIPLNLSALYPYPGFSVSSFPAGFWFFTIPAAAIIVFFVRSIIRKEMNMVFGMGFFIVNIILLLQLIPVGDVIMADRYAYVPSAGFFFLMASGTGWLIHKNPGLKQVILAVFVSYAILQGILTFNQTKVWKNSLTLWENATKATPEANVGWHNLGQILSNLNRKEEALECYNKSLIIDPNYHPSYKNRGSVLRELNRTEEAIKDFNKALELRFDNPIAWHSRGIAYETTGKLDKAMSDIHQAIKLNPAEALYYGSLARCYYRMGKIDSALIYYNKAISMSPKGVELYMNRGAAYTQLKKYDLAMADFNTAITISPGNATAFLNRGILKNMMQDNKSAMEDFNLSIQFKPDFFDAYSNRASLRQANGDKAGAISDYSMMAELRPDNPQAYYQRVLLNIELGRTDIICGDITKAISLGVKELLPYQQKYCK